MKSLLAVLCLMATLSTGLAQNLTCYECTLIVPQNADALNEMSSLGLSIGDVECQKPATSGAEADDTFCRDDSGSTTPFCFYTKDTVKYSRDSDGETFKYTIYNRGCVINADSNGFGNGHCAKTGVYEFDEDIYNTSLSYTVESTSTTGTCLCNNKDMCNTGGAAAVALSALTIMAAAILKFVH